MHGVRPHLVDDQAVGGRADLVDGGREVLAVLPAGGVAGVGAREQGEHPRCAEVERLVDGVREERLGVAVAPQHRGVDAAPVELGPKPGEQVAVEVVDRAAAAAGEVVLADRLEPRVGDVAAGGDPAQEGHDLVGGLGPAEGPEEDDVVGGERRRRHLAWPQRRRAIRDGLGVGCRRGRRSGWHGRC